MRREAPVSRSHKRTVWSRAQLARYRFRGSILKSQIHACRKINKTLYIGKYSVAAEGSNEEAGSQAPHPNQAVIPRTDHPLFGSIKMYTVDGQEMASQCFDLHHIIKIRHQ